MKKIAITFVFTSILTVLSCLMCPGMIQAQEVTVVGMGVDRDGALRDAARNAVEQVVGVLLDSRTLMSNLRIEMDEVYKESQGFVKRSEILEESRVDESTYRVKALIDVDTSPDAKLIERLTMIMRMNDPRIVVMVLSGTNAKGIANHDEEVESVLNARLMEMGFNHVADADQIIKLHGAEFLNSIYEGRTGIIGEAGDNACDYLVLGIAAAMPWNVAVPDYRTGNMRNSPLFGAKAKLNVKVFKYDTGDIVGTFVSEATGVGNNQGMAINRGMLQAASDAAKRLEDTFRHFGAKSKQGMTVIASAKDYGQVNSLVQILNSLGIVDKVYIRGYEEGKVVLEVDTAQKPYVLVTALRTKDFKFVVEQMSNSSLTLRLF